MIRRSIVTILLSAVFLLILGTGARAAPAQDAAMQRQEDANAMERKIDDLDKRMDDLAASEKRSGQPRTEMNRLYDEFKKEQGRAKENLERLRNSTNEAWQRTKEDMNKAIENLNGLYERSKARAGSKDGESR